MLFLYLCGETASGFASEYIVEMNTYLISEYQVTTDLSYLSGTVLHESLQLRYSEQIMKLKGYTRSRVAGIEKTQLNCMST